MSLSVTLTSGQHYRRFSKRSAAMPAPSSWSTLLLLQHNPAQEWLHRHQSLHDWANFRKWCDRETNKHSKESTTVATSSLKIRRAILPELNPHRSLYTAFWSMAPPPCQKMTTSKPRKTPAGSVRRNLNGLRTCSEFWSTHKPVSFQTSRY